MRGKQIPGHGGEVWEGMITIRLEGHGDCLFRFDVEASTTNAG